MREVWSAVDELEVENDRQALELESQSSEAEVDQAEAGRRLLEAESQPSEAEEENPSW